MSTWSLWAPLVHADRSADNSLQTCGTMITLFRSALARLHLLLDFALWTQTLTSEWASTDINMWGGETQEERWAQTNLKICYVTMPLMDGVYMYMNLYDEEALPVELMFSSHKWLIRIQVILFWPLTSVWVSLSVLNQVYFPKGDRASFHDMNPYF